MAQDGAIEISTAEGGYGRKQLYELIQNGADALVGGNGRIAVRLTDDTLYCANEGSPLTTGGVDALMTSHMSVKRGAEIGRFGLGFKSVIGISTSPHVFSRTGSLGFDRANARTRIEQVVPDAEKYPTLRVADALDPHEEARRDPVLAELMQWATTIVRLPLLDSADWLSDDLRAFPSEFLLFTPHVRRLDLQHHEGFFVKEIRTVIRLDGAVVLLEEGVESPHHIFERVHRPSLAAQDDAGELARRDEIPVMWAVPEKGRSRLGAFWAFFPTASHTTLSGIVNAPWKTNEDRHDILSGAFNQEILTSVLPSMVAEALPTLVDPDDPASFLDVLPARGRESRSWADGVINDAVFRAVASVSCLPDIDGELGSPVRLKLHPKDLRPDWLEAWSECPARPSDWVHHTTDKNNERRLKTERLLEKAGREPRSLVDWLEALCSTSSTQGSAAALGLAARIIAEQPELEAEVRSARILLTVEGDLECTEVGRVFLVTPEVEVAGSDLDFVHPDIAEVPGAAEALQRLGITFVDQSGRLRALVKTRRGEWSDPRWTQFWQLSRSVPVDEAARLLSEELGGRVGSLHVRTMAGGWTRLDRTFLPGAVVPADGHRDGAFTVDVDWHRDDRDLIEALGGTAAPTVRDGRPRESWLDDYEAWAVGRYYAELPKGGRRPSSGYLEVSGGPVPGPVGVMRELSAPGRAALTRAALDLGVERERHVSHATVGTYPRLEVEGPLTWFLRRHGLVETCAGPVPVDMALVPSTEPRDVLPVAMVTEDEAERLGIRRTIADLTANEWAGLLANAAGWADDARRSSLYVVAARHAPAPPTLHVRLGQRLVDVETRDVLVVSDPREFGTLAAQAAPVLLVDGDDGAQSLIEGWGLSAGSSLLATEISSTPAGEAVLLIDRFPPLRLYLPPDLEGLELVPCDEIQVNTVGPRGRTTEEREFLVHEGRVYVVPDTDEDLLVRLSNELGLHFTQAQIDHVLRQTQDHAARARSVSVRDADNDDERLLIAVGEEALRRSLPQLALESLERDGGKLDGRRLAQVARAVHGLGILGKLRPALTDNGFEPPERWAGTTGARRFVTGLGFSSELAGLPGATRPALATVDGPAHLPDLHDYQERVLDRILALLRGEGPRRGLVSLPTGAGKTRVAVEALVRHVGEVKTLGAPLLWIAQTDELCEQAVETWSYVWRAIGPSGRLHISRLWSSNDATPITDGHHLVVATDDKLSAVRAREDYRWLSESAVAVIDEAHTSISPTYTGLLDWLGRRRSKDARPLIGLTATPFRGVNVDETARLAGRYDHNRLDEGAFESDDPYAELQQRGVLSRVRHELLDGSRVVLTSAELTEMETFGRFPKQLETRLGADVDRNEAIVGSIASLPDDWTVLVFATSVENAEILAAMLATRGVPAVAVSAGTNPAERRHYIEKFRRREIRVITNYNVLVQGFDAPEVQAVYVARPTFSPNVYQQMIGRGLRGKVNGGSDEVLIVNVRDNFDKFGERLAFYDFEHLWGGRDRD
ncbi:sacsin N-terminal ATP-binding-like domain-containing protein [Pseudonocardia alni]|uniref:DEAD/DEAH box helicase family protein n=1 Tax=Pseudonocardia alni subsp. carboxydivorans TaxID=415010 RepID=A0ABU9AH11_PSEA5